MLAKVPSQMGYSYLQPRQEEVILALVRTSNVFEASPQEAASHFAKVCCKQCSTRQARCLPDSHIINIHSDYAE